MTNGKPGLYMYFSLWRDIVSIGDEYAGRMLRAALDYSEFGVEPEFTEFLDNFVWNRIKPGIDRDDARYQSVMMDKKYGGYVSAMSRKFESLGQTKDEYRKKILSREEWEQQLTAVNSSQPTTTPTPTTTPSPTTTSPGFQKPNC